MNFRRQHARLNDIGGLFKVTDSVGLGVLGFGLTDVAALRFGDLGASRALELPTVLVVDRARTYLPTRQGWKRQSVSWACPYRFVRRGRKADSRPASGCSSELKDMQRM
jgi:hypothetical protein